VNQRPSMVRFSPGLMNKIQTVAIGSPMGRHLLLQAFYQRIRPMRCLVRAAGRTATGDLLKKVTSL
jgi:hypothetical protein